MIHEQNEKFIRMLRNHKEEPKKKKIGDEDIMNEMKIPTVSIANSVKPNKESMESKMGPLKLSVQRTKEKEWKRINKSYMNHGILPKRKAITRSVQSLSWVQLFVIPWTAAHQACLSVINSRSLLRLMSIESVMSSNHLILCHPLFLPPSIFPSIRVFSNESALYIRWPKYWSFSFNISPSHEHPGLISFRMDWLDLLAVQGTLKSLLQ